ncbi:tripartite tricarboxylate transporter TctB family protein [Pseudooceanicola sp. C21-150M6]|uniref:tripartite tricarboxylate transporter TctB family protein n=1 Tax=Pseudooceanicola sp. C21-150M6 TaxID=3434355 RepID=UPI003D7FA9B3
MTGADDTGQGAAARLDLISGLILIVISLLALVWVIPVAVPGEAARGEVAPSLFPNLAAGVILICSLALVIVNRRALRMSGDGSGSALLVELLGWAVFATLLMVVLKFIGFIAASIFASAVATLVARHRGRWWIPVIIALGLPVFLQWAVNALFYINLP